MINFNKNEYILIRTSVFLIIILGIYLCFIGGYGSDEDTLPMIYVFESKLLNNGTFVSSRFTGNPVPEIGIGFLSHFFGSWAANLITYSLLVFGLIFFFFSFCEKYLFKELILFLFIALSSPILFFDNLEPIDYSWAFFFFSLGTLCLRKKYYELTILFFGICVGCRLNYVAFVLFATLFFNPINQNLNLNRRIIILISSIFIGGLFYMPIWFDNSFGLSWITAARPTDQGILGILARFLYKSYVAVGFLSSFVIIIILIKYFNKLKVQSNFVVLSYLALANLLIFIWIPAEYSYLQLFLVIVCFLVFRINSKKFIYLFCITNFISWIIFVSPIKVNYEDNDYCSPKNAISADFRLKFEKGFLFKYLDSRDKIKCWIYEDSERNRKILEGKALR